MSDYEKFRERNLHRLNLQSSLNNSSLVLSLGTSSDRNIDTCDMSPITTKKEQAVPHPKLHSEPKTISQMLEKDYEEKYNLLLERYNSLQLDYNQLLDHCQSQELKIQNLQQEIVERDAKAVSNKSKVKQWLDRAKANLETTTTTTAQEC